MTQLQILQHHRQLCDELHELALEENRFLQQHHRAPDASLLQRKRGLLARLDESLDAIRSAPRGADVQVALRPALDMARARILQILQLDKENEQLLLRFSLAGGKSPASPAAVPQGMLKKIYQRHS